MLVTHDHVYKLMHDHLYKHMREQHHNDWQAMTAARPRTFLGFDFGMKRIGIAAGQDLTATTTALEAVRVTDAIPDWVGITRLVNSWKPDALVVGVPFNLDGTEHDMTHAARDFSVGLQQRYGVPVHMIDERLSSLAAEQILAASGKKRPKSHTQASKQQIDSVAAQVILETWFAEQRITHR